MANDTVKFALGDPVYHKTGQPMGIVTGIMYRDNGPMYEVTWPRREIENHYGCELTKTKPAKDQKSWTEEE